METANEEHDHDNMSANTSNLKCCCGRPDCAYLRHNDAALGGLERDLDTAARLGQALLSRHESYITESQAEHARMSAYISELESERTSLQSANEKIVAENRDLLSQLESLNTSLATSDGEVKRLEDLLLDCELELKRLNGLVRQTEHLDGRVQEMERERVLLNRQISEGRDEVRGTLARWRESERKVRELEEDVRRIEREARAEQEKHEAIMIRMEKERALERELGGAEGRLKGAAAINSINSNMPGSKNVVSHFVKDILQDNANLQAGIAELRELLQSSNQEVQNLREQILLHQPVQDEMAEGSSQRIVSLGEELAQFQPSPKQVQQEVHVHHHYHAKIAMKDKPVSTKRPSRKRAIMPGHGYAVDAASPHRLTATPTTPMSLQHPQPKRNNRWSMQSTATQSSVYSSMPSSPRSYFDRNGSLFDRMEQGEEYSRPTSPESMADFYSPSWKNTTASDEVGLGVFEEEQLEVEDPSPLSHEVIEEEFILSEGDQNLNGQNLEQHREHTTTPKPSIVLQSDEDEEDTPRKVQSNVRENGPKEQQLSPMPRSPVPRSPLDSIPEIRPSLTRKNSDESMVSISGMDIHIAKRPSPISTLHLLQGNSSHFALSPSHVYKLNTAAPMASVTEFTVLSSGYNTPATPTRRIRRMPSGVEALSGIAVPAPKQQKPQPSDGKGITQMVGGWVRGKWGIAPMKSFADLRSFSNPNPPQSNDDEVSGDSSSSSVFSTDSSDTATVNNPIKQDTITKQQSLIDKHITCPPTSMPKPIPQMQDPQTAPTSTNARTKKSAGYSSPNVDQDFLYAGRSPGVNQRGFIPGFRAAVMSKKTPTDVVGRIMDEEALREGLCE